MQYIPETYFKGVQNTKDKCPLAFITPDGDDKAAENRIATVRQWAGGYQWAKQENAGFETIDNPPMSGFKIAEEVRRWSTSNVVWRIEDPRGFQLEISSGNMAYLMAEAVIDHGEVKAELQWVRNNAQNFLLPTDSEEYKNYKKRTAILKSDIKIGDLTVGDHIMLGNGTQGMYLGGYYTLEFAGYGDKAMKSVRRYQLKQPNGEIAERSGLKGISIEKKGDPKDNKDWSEYLTNKLDRDSGYNRTILYSKKKFNITAIGKTLRFEDSDVEGKNPSYMRFNGDVYTMSHYGGNPNVIDDRSGAADRIIENPEENQLDIDYSQRQGCRMFNFGIKSVKILDPYQKIMLAGRPVVLTVTVNDTDYYL